jgi:hypothetical protein
LFEQLVLFAQLLLRKPHKGLFFQHVNLLQHQPLKLFADFLDAPLWHKIIAVRETVWVPQKSIILLAMQISSC